MCINLLSKAFCFNLLICYKIRTNICYITPVQIAQGGLFMNDLENFLVKLMEWPNYISNRTDRLISNFLHTFLKIFFYYLGSIILPLFVANYFVSIDQMITRSSINFNAMVKSVIIFLIILYIQELVISKLLSKLCQSFQIKLFTDNEISFLKLFWIFINSILVILIIGIKDSLFEYIWAFILKGSAKDKIVIKFAYDILIVILQCISIVFTSSIITLEKCYKSRLINQINQKKFKNNKDKIENSN